MEKSFRFTDAQKALIWDRFVAPSNGTPDEAKHFVEYCETLGLNPILGDIVFQRFETKAGPRTSFIVTRDGLLRQAAESPNYVGAPIANVVKEGDEFEFIPSEGDVKHKFGQKRGKILGAYAVMSHRKFKRISVWAEFDEYFKANARSQGGRSAIWDSMPSAMIVKVAESIVLKRQFPLGGGQLYTAEEMGLDDISQTDGDFPVIIPEQPTIQSEKSKETHFEQPKTAQEQKVIEPEVQKPQVQNESIQKQKETNLKNSTAAQPQIQEEQNNNPVPEGQLSGEKFLLQIIEPPGISPGGINFAKVRVRKEKTGEQLIVLAQGDDAVELAKTIPADTPFFLETTNQNGFHFLKTVNGKGFAVRN